MGSERVYPELTPHERQVMEPRMIAQLVMRILPVLQLPPYAQNVTLAT